MTDIASFLVGLAAIITSFGVLISAIYKTKKQIHDSVPKKIQKQNNINMEIIQRMEHVKELLNADRVQIYEYHNGERWANGRSALSVDCSYEVVREGVTPQQRFLKNIPLSCIPYFHNTLLKEGYMYVENIEDIKAKMPSTYSLKKEQDIVSFYDIILTNKQKEPIGFLAVQSTTTLRPHLSTADRDTILSLKFFIEENLDKML